MAESDLFMQVYDNCDSRRSDGNGGLCMPHIHVRQDAVWRLCCYAVSVDHTSELFGSSAGKTSASFNCPVFRSTTHYHKQFAALRSWSTMIVSSNGLSVYTHCALSLLLLSVKLLAVHYPREGGGAGQTSLPGAQTPGKASLPIIPLCSAHSSPHNPILEK